MLLLVPPYQKFIGGQFEKPEINLIDGLLQRLIMFGDLSNQIFFLYVCGLAFWCNRSLFSLCMANCSIYNKYDIHMKR